MHTLIETLGGFNYTGADGRQWMEESGFRDLRPEPLAGPTSMLIGAK